MAFVICTSYFFVIVMYIVWHNKGLGHAPLGGQSLLTCVLWLLPDSLPSLLPQLFTGGEMKERWRQVGAGRHAFPSRRSLITPGTSRVNRLKRDSPDSGQSVSCHLKMLFVRMTHLENTFYDVSALSYWNNNFWSWFGTYLEEHFHFQITPNYIFSVLLLNCQYPLYAVQHPY